MNKFKLAYIIDDDPIFVMILRKILSKIDISIIIKILKNGEDALLELKRNNSSAEEMPDIIFLDLNMPVLDGWQFLEEIECLSFKKELNIFIISSTINISEIEKSKKFTSVKKFISKPLTTNELVDFLEYS